MANKVKWGVIGSGGIAQRRTIPEGIIPAEHAELVAVYDINSEVNANVARKFNVKAAQSIRELLDSDLDVVYIASPINLHLEQAGLCAKAKKHVFCEKPLGLNVEEAQKMINICQDANVLLGTGLMMRFQKQHLAALELIQKGDLGIPVYGRAQLSCWYPPIDGSWRQNPAIGGGGSLMDMGSHCIDLLEMFFGEVKSVSCFIRNTIHGYKSEDSAIVSLVFENGALATVDAFFCIPDNSSKNSLELYGSKGSIIAKGTIGQGASGEMVAYLEGNDIGYDAQQSRSATDGLVIDPNPVNMYMSEVEEFSRAILEKREPTNNYLSGLRNQIIIAACYQSAKTGQVVQINNI